MKKRRTYRGKNTNKRRLRMKDASFIRGSPTKIINNFEKKIIAQSIDTIVSTQGQIKAPTLTILQ